MIKFLLGLMTDKAEEENFTLLLLLLLGPMYANVTLGILLRT